MSRGLDDIAPALGALPLFPLPQTVLFPDALLPLHVFEPRYRAMIRDILDTHRTLSVCLITSTTPVDEHGHPEIATVAGVGTIVDYAELPGGRYDILIEGRARVRLHELPFEAPYRRARADLLAAEGEPGATDVSMLLSAATAFATLVRARDKTFDFRLPKNASAATIADLSAHQLILDVRERQRVLETLDVPARARRVAEALALQQLALTTVRGEPN